MSTGSTTGAWDELYESLGFNARWIENTRGEWRGIGRVGTMIRHEHSCGRHGGEKDAPSFASRAPQATMVHRTILLPEHVLI